MRCSPVLREPSLTPYGFLYCSAEELLQSTTHGEVENNPAFNGACTPKNMSISDELPNMNVISREYLPGFALHSAAAYLDVRPRQLRRAES